MFPKQERPPDIEGAGNPTFNRAQVDVQWIDDRLGYGVRTRIPHVRGAIVGAMEGKVTPLVVQHSLQVSAVLHIIDEGFAGYLLHSCDPNCVLDVHRFELLALRDIAAGDLLTIDYAVSEDILFRQFACACGAPNCRRWITGRREGANREGMAYLASLSARTA